MTRLLISFAILATVATSAVAQTAHEVESTTDLERVLIELNERVLVEYVLQNNARPLRESSLMSFFAVTPGGIESRSRVVATVGNLDVDSLIVENVKFQLHETTAVLAGSLTPCGTLGGRPMPTLTYLSVFVKQGDEWRLAARSLTPLVARAPGERPRN
jgi:hypothetical protein